jgi:hypothetical protein
MRSDAVVDGWQRFLDRLRRLWGKLGGGVSRPLAMATGRRLLVCTAGSLR